MSKGLPPDLQALLAKTSKIRSKRPSKTAGSSSKSKKSTQDILAQAERIRSLTKSTRAKSSTARAGKSDPIADILGGTWKPKPRTTSSYKSSSSTKSDPLKDILGKSYNLTSKYSKPKPRTTPSTTLPSTSASPTTNPAASSTLPGLHKRMKSVDPMQRARELMAKRAAREKAPAGPGTIIEGSAGAPVKANKEWDIVKEKLLPGTFSSTYSKPSAKPENPFSAILGRIRKRKEESQKPKTASQVVKEQAKQRMQELEKDNKRMNKLRKGFSKFTKNRFVNASYLETGVVLDIGCRFTKVGFVSESAPRRVLPTEFRFGDRRLSKPKLEHRREFRQGELIPTGQLYTGKIPYSTETWVESIKACLYRILYTYLQVKPDKRRIFICEEPFWPTFFKDALAQALFSLKVPQVCFVDTMTLPVFTTGTKTGLVVDVGYATTRVQATMEGHVVREATSSAPIGMRSVVHRFCDLMKEATQGKLDFKSLGVEDLQVERAVSRVAFVSTLGRRQGYSDAAPVSYEFRTVQGTAYVNIPGKIRSRCCEALFGENDYEEGVATLILDALIRSPIDVRQVLVSNIIFGGGTSMMPGFESRVLEELRSYMQKDVEESEYGRLRELVDQIHFVPHEVEYEGKTLKYPSNTRSWCGGAIFGSLKLPADMFITPEEFQESGEVPDWSDPV